MVRRNESKPMYVRVGHHSVLSARILSKWVEGCIVWLVRIECGKRKAGIGDDLHTLITSAGKAVSQNTSAARPPERKVIAPLDSSYFVPLREDNNLGDCKEGKERPAV